MGLCILTLFWIFLSENSPSPTYQVFTCLTSIWQSEIHDVNYLNETKTKTVEETCTKITVLFLDTDPLFGRLLFLKHVALFRDFVQRVLWKCIFSPPRVLSICYRWHGRLLSKKSLGVSDCMQICTNDISPYFGYFNFSFLFFTVQHI